LSTSPALITSREDLAGIVVRALRCNRVAIDTEFVWERTFYPRLALVQLALEDGEIGLVDAVAQPSLDILGLLLVAPAVQKVLHDGGQDLAILRGVCACGPPVHIFDTRFAAGFCDKTSTASLKDLVSDYGVELQKDLQRNDWTRRPLSPRELEYAAADVRHLIVLATDLEQQATERGNELWLQEELLMLERPEVTEERDPRACYLRIKGRGKLESEQLAALVELTAWREDEARRRDRPRQHIVADRDLLELAGELPRRASGLRLLRPKERGLYGEQILAAVARGSKRHATVPMALESNWRARKSAAATQRADALIALVEEKSHARGIDPALVASRGTLRGLAMAGEVATPEDFPLLADWRAQLLGDDLQRILRT